MSEETILLGAVGTDAHRVNTWDEWRSRAPMLGFAFDYVLYSNYDRLVDDLMCGMVNAAVLPPAERDRAERRARTDDLELSVVGEIHDAVLAILPVSADEAAMERFVRMVAEGCGHLAENASPPAKKADENSSARVARPRAVS